MNQNASGTKGLSKGSAASRQQQQHQQLQPTPLNKNKETNSLPNSKMNEASNLDENHNPKQLNKSVSI